MNCNLPDTGIPPDALARYIEEQIYIIPGTSRHREEFTILLTGSRSIGHHTSKSDVDIDVLCPSDTYDVIHRAALDAGLIDGRRGFFCPVMGPDYHRYFGPEMSCPHFSVTPLEIVERQFIDYEDVPLWIWTHARVIADPNEEYKRIRESFKGYPRDILIRKIKHRWLCAQYAAFDIYPYHHNSDDDTLPAISAISTMVNELLRFFFLVDGKPFPYTERLMKLAKATALGQQFCPLLQNAIDLAIDKSMSNRPAWERLDEAMTSLLYQNTSTEADRMVRACSGAMKAAGVESDWVEHDYDNIDELLWGELGPAP